MHGPVMSQVSMLSVRLLHRAIGILIHGFGMSQMQRLYAMVVVWVIISGHIRLLSNTHILVVVHRVSNHSFCAKTTIQWQGINICFEKWLVRGGCCHDDMAARLWVRNAHWKLWWWPIDDSHRLTSGRCTP